MTTEALDYEAPPKPDLLVAMGEYARLAINKRDKESDLDAIAARMKELEPHILEGMAEAGIQRQTVQGMTLFPTVDFYVTKKSEADGVKTSHVCEALRLAGWGYMVSDGYSSASLKAKVRELREDGLEIPPELSPVLNVGETVRLSVRKA